MDPSTQTPWYSFLDEFGMAGQGFFDNAESLLLKYDFVASVPGLGLGLFAVHAQGRGRCGHFHAPPYISFVVLRTAQAGGRGNAFTSLG
jgi:hypothetical protein